MSRLSAVVVGVWDGWNRHGSTQLAAALAYYGALSFAPLTLVILAVAGLFFDIQSLADTLVTRIPNLGAEATALLESWASFYLRPEAGVVALVGGFAVALYSATGLLLELRAALRRIWDLPPEEGIRGFLRGQLVALAVLGVLAVAVVVALVAWQFAGSLFGVAAGVVRPLVTIGACSALFAAGYRYLPGVPVRWISAAAGAVPAAVAFWLSALVIDAFFFSAAMSSIYGAAASFVVLLLWVYVVGQILLVGAEVVRAVETTAPAADG